MSKLLEEYRESETSPQVDHESESSPEVDREGLATAADEPEASPTRKRKWHDQLQRLNPFHRSRAADSSSHETDSSSYESVEILVDSQSEMTNTQSSGSDHLNPPNADEVSVSVRAIELITQKETLTSISSQLIFMMMFSHQCLEL